MAVFRNRKVLILSGTPLHRIMNSDSDPDPALFFLDFRQMPSRHIVSFFSHIVCLLLIEGTFAVFNIDQILLLQDKDNFFYIFLLSAPDPCHFETDSVWLVHRKDGPGVCVQTKSLLRFIRVFIW